MGHLDNDRYSAGLGKREAEIIKKMTSRIQGNSRQTLLVFDDGVFL
jgi:hypothetical protein